MLLISLCYFFVGPNHNLVMSVKWDSLQPRSLLSEFPRLGSNDLAFLIISVAGLVFLISNQSSNHFIESFVCSLMYDIFTSIIVGFLVYKHDEIRCSFTFGKRSQNLGKIVHLLNVVLVFAIMYRFRSRLSTNIGHKILIFFWAQWQLWNQSGNSTRWFWFQTSPKSNPCVSYKYRNTYELLILSMTFRLFLYIRFFFLYFRWSMDKIWF